MTDEAGRLLHQQLADHEQDVLRHWISAAQQRLAGRVTEAELLRSFGDLLPALRDAVELAGLDVRPSRTGRPARCSPSCPGTGPAGASPRRRRRRPCSR